MDAQHDPKDSESLSVNERLAKLEKMFAALQPAEQDSLLEMLDAGDLAEDLRVAIRDSGLSRYSIAKQCGVGQSILDRFVTGERDMRVETAAKICRLLGYRLAKVSPETEPSAPVKKKPKKKKPPG